MSPPQVSEEALPTYTREEVAQHNKSTDCWVVLHGQVYDVTKWLPRHPGGARIILHYAGQDATVCRRLSSYEEKYTLRITVCVCRK